MKVEFFTPKVIIRNTLFGSGMESLVGYLKQPDTVPDVTTDYAAQLNAAIDFLFLKEGKGVVSYLNSLSPDQRCILSSVLRKGGMNGEVFVSTEDENIHSKVSDLISGEIFQSGSSIETNPSPMPEPAVEKQRVTDHSGGIPGEDVIFQRFE
jgi:hypothetical protein